ncbi:hypothetical protein D3C72_1428410 [compost metagenome]
MKAHADFLGGMDTVIELAAVGVDVEMVARGGAAGEYQFSHRRLGRHRDHFWRQACPDGVQVGQPIEQLAILGRRYDAGEALVHVVVRVDQAWNDHFPGHVQHHIGLLR